MERVSYSDYARFNDPLKPEEFICFDAKPNSSVIALKKSDFEGNDSWSEYVVRYAKTAKYTRTNYYLNRMSDPLKEELFTAIVRLWQEAESEEIKGELAEVLEQDFSVRPEEIKSDEDIRKEFDEGTEDVQVFGSHYRDADGLRNSRYLIYAAGAGGSVFYPFRFADQVKVAPKLGLTGYAVDGSRRLEGQGEEAFAYNVAMFQSDVRLLDSAADVWNAGANVTYSAKYGVPTGFADRSVTWIGDADIDRPFAWPIDLAVAFEGMNEHYIKSAEADQYRKAVDQLKVKAPLTYVLSNKWSVISGYDYGRNHTTQYYSKETSDQHTGSLALRQRGPSDFLDFVANASYKTSEKERKVDGETAQDNNERTIGGAGCTYFKLLGGKRSFQASTIFNYVDSDGDLDAQFPEAILSATAFFNLLDNLEVSFNGSLLYDYIYQAGRQDELTYTLMPSATLNFSKNLSANFAGTYQQTTSRGEASLNEAYTNMTGILTLSAAFRVFGQRFGSDLVVTAGRSYDGENFDETMLDTTFFLKAFF